MTQAITLTDVSHAYKNGIPVLKGIDLQVESGELLGLIGLSGAGKSTLLRCINGLIVPTYGSCEVLGERVDQMTERQRRTLRRRIGMIFQEFNLVDRMSVHTNVLIGRLGYLPTMPSCLNLFAAADRDAALDALDQVGLSGLHARRVRDLSGGQKQRVAIARTILQGAEIVLADEATANLDALTKDEIMDLLAELVRSRGVTIILSTHDLVLARRYCTRIVGLKDGLIAFDAKPDALDDKAAAEVLRRTPEAVHRALAT